ncbi:MAG: hypothetical protein FIA98_02790 [Anaerolineae bacterium]|nr:hypothetical protein [Anaerolineae bacterium]
MRRFFGMIFILIVAAGCAGLPISLLPTATPTASLQPTLFATASLTATPSPAATASLVPATSVPVTPPTPSSGTFEVLYHPDDVLYVGDQISFEVVSLPGVNVQGSSLRVQIDPPSETILGPVDFGPWGIAGRSEASMIWAWDTSNLQPGYHNLEFSVQPQGITRSERGYLLPREDMPPDQAAAHWVETRSACCAINYITNTASERDLTQLTTSIDSQAQDAMQKMSASFTEPITITILPRLLGHGGFTASEISVSYLDRNYAANLWEFVVHHEMIHAIDAHLEGDFRPTIFVEGLAVYMTGGHYKPEPLMPRAAALLPVYTNMYIPLITLSDDFYAQQHEIGYLEGAALIEYMVKTYGQEAFLAFYRDIHTRSGEAQSASIDAALQAHFSISFAQLEQDFLAALQQEPDTSAWVDDITLTVTYYDTMRRYQQLLDPSAYFRTAWLMDNKSMRERGIVADYLRHPHTPTNLALETLFITAHQHMSNQDYTSARRMLEYINLVLDGLVRDAFEPFSISQIASDYLAIVNTLLESGYEVQRLNVSGNTASCEVTTSTGPTLTTVNLSRTNGAWMITP